MEPVSSIPEPELNQPKEITSVPQNQSKSNMPFPIIIFALVVVLLGGTGILYVSHTLPQQKTTATNTPSQEQPKSSSSHSMTMKGLDVTGKMQLEQNEQQLDTNVNSLTDDINNIDQELNDQPIDLSSQ